MAWLPIAYTVPQYYDPDTNTPASGFVLKAYEDGTTTNTSFSTDSTGNTTVTSIALNADGFPEVSGNIVLPHIDQDYKLALYPDQASADSDTGATWTIDNITLLRETTTSGSAAQVLNVWPLTDYGGAYFDGSNDYLTRGAGLTGASDGKKGTLVAFLTFDTEPASSAEYILHSTGDAFIFRRTADGEFEIVAENSGGSVVLSMKTSGVYESNNTVYCVMASWDMADAGSNQLYVNDASDVATTTFTNDTIDYTVADWAVGADVSGTNKMTGNVLSLWFDPTDNIDFDTELNRRRFLDESDNAVYLGRKGELPTGTQSILFLGNNDETAFELNRGSGGNFTENGTMAAATVTFDGQYQSHTDKVVTTQGDIIVGDANKEQSRLAVGSNNQVPISSGTTLSYGLVDTANLATDAVTTDKITSGAVDQDAIAASAVGQSELKTSTANTGTGTLSASGGATNLSLTGGGYSHWAVADAGNPDMNVDASTSTSNFTIRIRNESTGDESCTLHERYHSASRPYDMGDGEVGAFISAIVLPDGSIEAVSIAPDPIWAYNGPTDIRPDFVDKHGRLFKRLSRPSLTCDDLKAGRCDMGELIAARKEAEVEIIEITQEYKNQDMGVIQHPWLDLDHGTVILLDPVNTHDLLMLHEAGEDVDDLIHRGYIEIDNKALKRKGPPGVAVHGFKWKRS